jgi:hypothetical protein
MSEPATHGSGGDDVGFSLVRGGPSYRIRQKLGLIPSGGLGIPRRMLCFMLLTWVPIMVWAIVHKRVYAGVIGELLLPMSATSW